MKTIPIYSYEGEWLLVDGTKSLYCQGATSEEMAIRVKEYTNLAENAYTNSLQMEWNRIRDQRDRLLIESDWSTLPDATPKPNKLVWINYRQALRDITKTYSNPEDVVWPQKPSQLI